MVPAQVIHGLRFVSSIYEYDTYLGIAQTAKLTVDYAAVLI